MSRPVFEPIILSVELTADLYHLVTFSVEPGRRMSAIVGPRGATDEQVRAAIAHLVANIS